jgi:hypothetical protein
MWVTNEPYPSEQTGSAARFQMNFDDESQQVLRESPLVNTELLLISFANALKLPGASLIEPPAIDKASTVDNDHDHLSPI